MVKCGEPVELTAEVNEEFSRADYFMVRVRQGEEVLGSNHFTENFS